MAKLIPVSLQDAYGKRGTSTCFIIKVVTRENVVYGFTTADFVVRFDDGLGVVAYKPDEELRPQNIQSSADMTVDNTKLIGWFSQTVEQKILSGAFDAAEITIYRVAYLRLSGGYEIVGYGTVGEIEYSSDAKDKRKVEFRSLTQQLVINANQFYSLTCRAEFGDDKCGMPFVWFDGTVETLPNQNDYLVFKVNGITQPDGYFELGVIRIVDGPNAGADLEVESWATNGAQVKLSYIAPYPLTDGTAVRLRKDCGKTETDCIAYGNIVNMRAEHLTPTEDQSLMVPGAYIKSQNSL
ncbi:putative tail protein [Xanthomonas phage Langgrundblatt2]|uniref:Tail protein n=1 Tax=Xanthomonas phage Langgrundblatt2 TaxID=2939129 RepID=A0A9E7E101_9CAUD|nr:putative tail protein [Xanthomonas phage Langgrundblatt2]URA06877.1 putative tail protein [Xanthomonas phage Langgrundblatt2]